MGYQIVCLKCKSSYELGDELIINVSKLLEESRWGRITIKTSSGKETGWLCENCLKELGLF
ncbi:MAG: hypothetical protein NZ893_01565 [Candidatus Aenigmarchaeota archaeon]|nr:hypothetical protein [Candidatus Aenigmarchaeota archaeon]